MTIAAIIRGGPQGLSPTNASKIISIILKTTPATRPAPIAAFQAARSGEVAV
jgi:hypothetical protein